MTKSFDERNALKSRRVCEAMDEAASTSKRVLTERERQILDMWPRFEDGEYVWFGDAYVDGSGDANKVMGVRFNGGHVFLVGIDNFLTVFNIVECAKRPAPKDSWEQLEEDAEFNDETGIVGGNLDIVRRAKALAGMEVGR